MKKLLLKYKFKTNSEYYKYCLECQGKNSLTEFKVMPYVNRCDMVRLLIAGAWGRNSDCITAFFDLLVK